MAKNRIQRSVKVVGALREAAYSRVDEEAAEYGIKPIRAKRMTRRLTDVEEYASYLESDRKVKPKNQNYRRNGETIRKAGFYENLAEEIAIQQEAE